jgi:hypothetical protein
MPHARAFLGFGSVLCLLSDRFSYSIMKIPEVTEIRIQVIEIVQVITASDVFTERDFLALIDQWLALEDVREVAHLLGLIKTVLTLPSSHAVHHENVFCGLWDLRLLLASSNEVIVWLMIDIILLIDGTRFGSGGSLDGQIKMMLTLPSVVCHDLIANVRQLTVRHAASLTLLFFGVYRVDATNQHSEIVASISPEEIHNNCQVLAMMCVVKYQGEFGKSVLEFLLRCRMSLITLYASLDVICVV